MNPTLATKQTVTFTCALDCQLGAYHLEEGESLKAVSDGQGLFYLYIDWADGAIGRFSANDINKLAGYQAVQ